MKIILDNTDSCISKDCSFKVSCAQHETAGDYRMEDGFTPELDFETLNCNTADQRVIIEIEISYHPLPANINLLKFGFLVRKK